MTRFFPVAVMVDGRRYSGDWCLMQGDRVCVRSLGFGSLSAEIGKERPEVAAAKTLEKIVRADQKARADWAKYEAEELAKLSKPKPSRSRRLPRSEQPDT